LHSQSDPIFVDYLVTGLKEGFHTGISNEALPPFQAPNMLSARSDPESVSKLLQTELDKGYLIGPFDTPPFDTYRINPIGLAVKRFSGKKRLIVDMSAPRENLDYPSINSLISKDQFSLSYVKVDDAINIIKSLGPGSWLCKTDITDAFKQIPIMPSLWKFHGITWKKRIYFFIRLVFGCRSSPKIFDHLSEAVCWIAKHRYKINAILHLLDDFLTVDPPSASAQRTMALLKLIFKKLGIPLSKSKTVGPTHCLEYLGIILDTIAMEARLPPDKLQRLLHFLSEFLALKQCTKRQLLSLLGHLNFAARVVPPGRTFMSRLLTAAKRSKRLHHKVCLNKECKADILMWQYLLSHWNGISLFLENEPTTSADLDLFTDSSGTIGFGGFHKGHWFFGVWPSNLKDIVQDTLSIAFQELYPIVVAAMLWGKSWSRKRVVFHCDNQATVHILNKGRSNAPSIMKLMRQLVITATLANFHFSGQYLPSRANVLADALSRLQIAKFRKLAPHADPHPCPLPCNVMFG
jgi:hypothetical protein